MRHYILTFTHAQILFFVIAASLAWGQTGLPELQFARPSAPADDDRLQKLIDGQYAPEIYKVKADDGDEERLLKQQINCLYAECAILTDHIMVGSGSRSIEQLLEARRRLGDTRLEYHPEFKERRKIMEEQLDDARELEAMLSKRISTGVAEYPEAVKAAYFRLKVELALVRLEKAERQGKPGAAGPR